MADNIYVQAADIFTNALAKKAHVKSLVYASKYPNKKKLYALVCQGLKYQNILHEIATSLNILKNETYALRQNMPLLQLLLYDKIFGKGICGSRRFKNVMRKYRDKINNHCELLIKEKGLDNVKELLTYDNENVQIQCSDLESTLNSSLPHFSVVLRQGHTGACWSVLQV
uniref:NSUN5/RCM1 N-terminal domain-containing protein n=1 Tax=Octopus bimaculoides TaxID=37653 RepID=A0A0L8HA02_OCTBM